MSFQNFTALLLNLDRDTERLEHMRKQLETAGVSYSRQSGVVGNNIPADLNHYFYDAKDKPLTTMKRGEMGCYASHLQALKRVASGELGYTVLIMEDDLDIPTTFLEVVLQAQHAMPLGWDILRLSSPARRAYAPIAKLNDRQFLVKYSKIPTSAGAYLVTLSGAQKFLRRGIRGLTFDDDLRRPWFHGMQTYGIEPAPVKAGVLQSSIDAMESGRFDKGMSSRMERTLRGDHFYFVKRLRYNVTALGWKRWLGCGLINTVDMIVRPILGRPIIDRAAKLFLLKDSKQQ